ncbi:MAG: OsmC family protein [Planctomycetes bacterium]|nr:OsmC family protein [Planctomycetota bacterium]
MAVTISCEYLGDLRVRSVHGPSKTELITDAPTDNHGKGESFSPTDLAATALATCYATIMGIQAQTLGIELKGMKIEIEKHMTAKPPRRIARLAMAIRMPAGISPTHQDRLKLAAAGCPVHASLHPDVAVETVWTWG